MALSHLLGIELPQVVCLGFFFLFFFFLFWFEFSLERALVVFTKIVISISRALPACVYRSNESNAFFDHFIQRIFHSQSSLLFKRTWSSSFARVIRQARTRNEEKNQKPNTRLKHINEYSNGEKKIQMNRQLIALVDSER